MLNNGTIPIAVVVLIKAHIVLSRLGEKVVSSAALEQQVLQPDGWLEASRSGA